MTFPDFSFRVYSLPSVQNGLEEVSEPSITQSSRAQTVLEDHHALGDVGYSYGLADLGSLLGMVDITTVRSGSVE